VSHQLQALLSSGYVLPKCPDSAPSFAEVRTIASRYIRDNRDMFEAYIEEDFDDYCRKIASVSDCVWGGQVELNALTHALQIPIWIYDTVQPVLKMGTEFGTDQDAVVRLSFHRHYYSLGEHYNSVVPC
jgi:OTU domain-containing protein 6